jgi:O-antigen ligase
VIGAATAVEPPPRSGWWLVVGFAALLAAGVWAAAAGEPAAAALVVTAAVAAVVARRNPEALLGVWIATTPWASYALRFPAERSIVTFDRVVVLAIVAGFLARARRERGRLPGLTVFEVSWACFAAVAAVSSIALADEKPLALRITAEAFVLPALRFYAIRVGFSAGRGARAVFWGALALALALPWVGLVEFVTARDVMPFKGASIFRTGIVRANGPFQTDNSYSIIAALVGVFVYWLPSALRLRLDGASRAAWVAAQASAYLAALVPIFRAIMGAIAAALALPAVLGLRVRSLARAAILAALLAVAALPALIPVSQTATFRDRITDPSSAFSRAATYLAALDVIEDHPLAGVGLTNYHAYFESKFGTAWYVDVEAVADVGAESYPHNNLLGVWAELGAAGAFFYVLAAVALAGDAWRRRAMAALALMVVYWVPGMFLESGVYPDLNLYYFAMLGVLLARDSAPADV